MYLDERLPLRFGQHENGEEDPEQAEPGEDPERPVHPQQVAERLERLGNDERVHPGVERANRRAHRLYVRREYLPLDDVGDGVQADRVHDYVDENAGGGQPGEARDVRLEAVLQVEVDSLGQQGEAADGTGGDEEGAAADLVDEEGGGGDGRKLDQAEEDAGELGGQAAVRRFDYRLHVGLDGDQAAPELEGLQAWKQTVASVEVGKIMESPKQDS